MKDQKRNILKNFLYQRLKKVRHWMKKTTKNFVVIFNVRFEIKIERVVKMLDRTH